MKRAKVEEGFNPVYPYGYNNSTEVAPPFVAADGLQENPPGVLSLKIAPPLTFNTLKALTLAIGSGLSIVDGKLVSKGQSLLAQSPLVINGNELQLRIGAGLNSENDTLNILAQAPLAISNTNKLNINLGEGLSIVNGALQLSLTASSPLSLQNNILSLPIGDTLEVVNGKLQSSLAATNPLELDGNTLRLNIGNTLQVQNNALQTSLQAQSPLTISNNTLQLAVGTGLAISSNNTLQTNLRANGPITISGNTFSLSLAPSSGLRNRSGLQVQTGWGLKIANNNDVTLDFRNPLFMTTSGEQAGQLGVKIGSGLQLDNSGNIQTQLGNGLSINNNAIAINAGGGLTISNNTLQVATGTGLTILDGLLTATGVSLTQTLWTTPDPSPNCNIEGELDAKFVLALTTTGTQVVGTCSIYGLKTLTNISSTSIAVQLDFDSAGVLQNSSTMTTSYWGYRQNQSISPYPITNALSFMPNSTAYPAGQGNQAKSNTYIQTLLRGNTDKPITLNVTFNNQPSGYSLKFTWTGLGSYQNEPFATPTCTFSYIAQQ